MSPALTVGGLTVAALVLLTIIAGSGLDGWGRVYFLIAVLVSGAALALFAGV